MQGQSPHHPLERNRINTILRNYLSDPIRRRILVTSWHTIGIMSAYYLAFLLRFDFIIPYRHLDTFLQTLPVTTLGFLFAFSLFRLYRGIWMYFSLDDILYTGAAILLGTAFNAVMIYFVRGQSFADYPRSAFLSTMLFLLMWETGWRFLIRWFKKHRNQGEAEADTSKRSILIGNSEQVDILLRRRQFIQGSIGEVVAIVTNDVTQQNLTMHGLKISGPISSIGQISLARKATTLVILPPYTGPKEIRAILESCSVAESTPDFRIVPSIDDLATGRLDISVIRDVKIEDLLNREPARFDRKIIADYLRGKSVMITGAGGSIGAEIARQVAAQQPSCIILFEISEFALYTIDQELLTAYPNLQIIAYMGDVRSRNDVQDAIFSAERIDVIYHAAAYKHVPLMERNASAGFHNNVLGSNNVATVAHALGVERMVFISTDKAVRPTSIMGATKRLAERCVLQQPREQTSFVAVRFGNVLGSSGSVLPLFKRQIEQGGPVTVTTPDTRRYFMTIPEAVELVLMAGIVGEDRQIMVLEMGEPIKIVDLARRLIELSGFVPDKDIQIEFIGLRPGEKEYEELMTEDENVVETPYEKIWTLAKTSDNDQPIELDRIEQLIDEKDHDALRKLIADHVPESYFATPDLPIQERIPSLEE